MKNKFLKTLLGLLVAAILLYLAMRGQPFSEIIEIIFEANFWYVLIAIFFYFLSFVARSEKWRIQVENLDFKLIPKTAFYALILHFFVNSFTTKLGGIVRCGNLSKTAKVSFPACFGSYFSECIFDFMFMFLVFFIILSIQFNEILLIISNLLDDFGLEFLKNKNFLILIGIIAVFFGSLLIYLYKKQRIFNKYKSKIQEFIASVKKTFKLKKFWLFIVWNIVLWVMLFFMNYFLFLSLFDEASFMFIFTITVFIYAAWLLPTPGGIGSVEYFALQAFLLFGLSQTAALSFGILSNALSLFSTLFFGFVMIIIQSISKYFTQKEPI